MELFKISGSVDVNNSNAIGALNQTNDKASLVAKQMQQKFETIGTAFNKIGEGMTKAGTLMTSTLTLGIGGLATAGIKYNMEMENFQMNLTTLLGSSEKATKLLSDLQEMAATTPFETTDLISATETMIGFGIASKDAQEYLGMIGDIAMGDSNKLAGLSLAFSQVQSTGRLTGQDLLQMINQGFNPLKYISEMTGKSMATLKEEMADGSISAKMVADAFEYATSKGQPFYKGMENGAKTVSGRISTLKDNFMILVGNLTESLLPVFEKIVDKAIELTEKFSNLSDEQKEQVLRWAGIVAAIGPVLIIVGKLVSGLGGLFSIIGKIKGAGGLAGLATKFGGLASAAGPVIAVIAGVVAGIALLVHVLGGPKEALEKLKIAFEKVKETIQTFIEKMNFGEKLEAIKEKFGVLSEKLKGLKDLFKVVGVIIGAQLAVAFATLSGLFNAAINAIEPLMTAIGGIIDILAGLGSLIVAVFTGDWKKAWESCKKIGQGIVDVFKGLWDAVWGILRDFIDGVIGFFESLWDTLVGHSIVPDMINAIIDWFKQLLNKPIEFVKNLKDKVVNFFGDLKDKTIEKVKGLVNGAKEKFNQLKTNVVNKANEIKTNAVNKFNELKSSASEKFNALKSSASEKFNSMKTAIVSKASEIKDNAVSKFEALKSSASNKFEALKSAASSKFNSIKSVISDKVSQAKTKAVSLFQSMNTATNGKLGTLVSSVKSKFGSVYTNIKDKMQSAKDKVTSILNSMKNAFSNFKGKIKMPHIKVTGDWDLKKLKIPKFSVDWYAKAMDNGIILDEATIFGVNKYGQPMGAGEKGSETIVGTNSLMSMIRQASSSNNLQLEVKLDALINILLQYLPELSSRQLCLDSGALVGALVNPMDKALADKTKDRRRGR